MAKSVAIIYGFAEGSWHGKRLRKALLEVGYTLISDPLSADVVVSHSGGAFEIPELGKEQLLVLIGPPYWPNKTKNERGRAKLRQDLTTILQGPERSFNIRKVAMNVVYFIGNYPRMVKIIRDAELFNLEKEVKHQNTILIRNAADPWLTSDLDKLQKLNPHFYVHRLPGTHDDCWYNPKPYVHLIQSDVQGEIA